MTNIKATDSTAWTVTEVNWLHSTLLGMQMDGDVIRSVSIDAIKRTTEIKCTDKNGRAKFVDIR